MVGVVVKKIKLSEIKLNPDNPRQISEKDMARLVKSLQEFPDLNKSRLLDRGGKMLLDIPSARILRIFVR